MQFGWKFLLPLSVAQPARHGRGGALLWALRPSLFYVLAALAVVRVAAASSAQRNPIYSVMSLIGSFGALAGLYVLLDSPFTAVTQIIVYAGAIMVLFLFVVMLLNVPREDAAEWDRSHPLNRPGAQAPRRGARGVARRWSWAGPSGTSRRAQAVALDRRLGRRRSARWRRSAASIFTDYAFPFEATSILILVAMVGAVVLARKEQE